MSAPMRTCVGCRAVRPKSELMRLVVADGRVVVDRDVAAQGRGAYVCPRGECVERARGKLARALRANVRSVEVKVE